MKKSVLIVDDEFGIADVIAELLIDAGYDAGIAINGRLGLAAMLRNRPDLVVADVMMPVLDGPGMVRAMRADPSLACIPVVMMTALLEALPQDVPPLYQAKLGKPFTPEQLMAALDIALGTPICS